MRWIAASTIILLLSTSVWAECPDFTSTRRPFFGDLHSHSSYSLDAFLIGRTRNDPWDAYAFAKKEKPLPLTPIENGQPTQSVEIDRPLDFVAVTDHSEMLGTLTRFIRVQCSYDGRSCPRGKLEAWENTQQAANENYDECNFTTFIAYEYTKQQVGDPSGVLPNNTQSMLHRNVIFRNEHVPLIPFSFLFAPNPQILWTLLDFTCIKSSSGCDVLAIPHSSNLSNGFMFPDYSADNYAAQRANLQHRFEPLVEITQHKGASECQYGEGLSSDEECDFENVNGYGNSGSDNAVLSDSSYVRSAMKTGLQMQNKIGVNPYQMGFIGSTDNHNSTPGAVKEDIWKGHLGAVEDTTEKRLSVDTKEVFNNPGGLAAVWAEENTRDSIFDALRRRETYATSGPRMRVRVFGGWDLPHNLCGQSDWLRTAYTRGVPMGGELGEAPTGKAPSFIIQAEKDAGGLAHNLERVQIIKGWTDSNGDSHEQVYDIYGEKVADSVVDTTTCEVQTDTGFETACTGWTDPDFDPTQNAFYYSRVLEVPSCRWSKLDANAAGVEHPENVHDIVRERAWTSPIWVSAQGTSML